MEIQAEKNGGKSVVNATTKHSSANFFFLFKRVFVVFESILFSLPRERKKKKKKKGEEEKKKKKKRRWRRRRSLLLVFVCIGEGRYIYIYIDI